MDDDNPQFWQNFSGYGKYGAAAISSAGVPMTPEKARTWLTFFACVALRARTIGSLQCGVALDTGTRFEPVEHYLNTLLDLKPNRDTQEFNFFETIVHHLDLWGNFYAIKKRNRMGKYSELLQISDPSLVYPYYVRDGQKILLCDDTMAFPGQLVYEVHRTDGELAKIYPKKDILHIANISQNGIVGLSQIGIIRETAGKFLSAQTQNAQHYNGDVVTAAGIVTIPYQIEGEGAKAATQAIRAEIENVRTGGVAVLDEDKTYIPIKQMPATDAQFIESQQFDAYTICGWLGVPPHKVGLPVNTSYSSLETQNSDFKDGCIFPLGMRITKTMSSDLLSPGDIETKKRITFNYDTLFKADKKARGEYNSKMFSMGATPNTIMARESWPPITPEQGGDTSFRLGNTVPLNTPATTQTPTTEAPVETDNDNEN